MLLYVGNEIFILKQLNEEYQITNRSLFRKAKAHSENKSVFIDYVTAVLT